MGNIVTNTAWLAGPSNTSLIPGLTSTVVLTGTIDAEIARGEAFVNSFAGRLYTPSDYLTAPTIQMVTEDIVTYRIFNNYVYNRPEGQQSGVGERIQNRYETALAVLEQLRDGNMELHKSDGTRIATRSRDDRFFISTENYTPTFEVDGELAWQVSKRRQQDLDDDRLND